MSARSDGDQPLTGRGYSAGGSLVAYPRPDEVVVPLRRDEFDTLCEGGVSEEKASRDLYIGAGVGAFAGLVGVLATTDWDTTWKPERRGSFLFFVLVLCVMVTVSVVGACIHRVRLNRIVSNSAFSRLRVRLLGLFNEPRTPDAAVEKLDVLKTLPSAAAEQISAPSDVKWENSASLFWLGSDLDWTAQTALHGAPKERVLHGLTQCGHHSSQLGLANSAPGKQLSALKSQVENLLEEALDIQWRKNFAEKISSIISEFNILMKQHQPDFRPRP